MESKKKQEKFNIDEVGKLFESLDKMKKFSDKIIEKTLEIFNTPIKRDLRRRLILSTLKMLEEQGFVITQEIVILAMSLVDNTLTIWEIYKDNDNYEKDLRKLINSFGIKLPKENNKTKKHDRDKI